MWTVLLSSTCILSLLTYAYFSIAQFQIILPFTTNNIVIVTAHPDDECMFFGPTILSLRTLTKSRIHVLCLSSGNADGLGSIRRKELVKSCQTMGIQASNVKTIENPGLQDGMQNKWDPELISNIINEYVIKQKIDTIITFDGYGVSGHVNHISTFQGVKHYISKNPTIQLYRLVSIPLVRKYIGILDLLLPMKNTEKITLVSSPIGYLNTHKAMRQHKSQLVWFRWLYVTFSRYMFVNDLVLDSNLNGLQTKKKF